jgi:Protein involved in formate dehydrogenase formation
MTFLAASRANYSARLARAELLGAQHLFATEILAFYRKIATFQKEFYDRLPKAWGKHPVVPVDGNLRSTLHLPALIGPFADFLLLVQTAAPAPLAAEARQLRTQEKDAWAPMLQTYWNLGLEESRPKSSGTNEAHPAPLREFLSRAYLQPYAEYVTGAMLPPNLPMTVCRCPRCNSLPLLGVLRPEGDGGKRFLQCAFCSQEWEFRRIFCAHCGEEREDKLPVFVAEQFPHIRVESCDTCKYYLRSIDLTKDGNAVPLVDDLAAIPLSFWAEEHGYRRIQSNLLGT